MATDAIVAEVNGVDNATVQPDNIQSKCNKSRRFMIYVHSKMLIVDDEYIIVGAYSLIGSNMMRKSTVSGHCASLVFCSYAFVLVSPWTRK